ncbi:MAG: hypothetical protein J07HQW1_01936 [Haloquadratum walsbyi J07HQW1]|uniref:Uncharacterized protein n=1 Tax=Haloquadratum walsbyi J07HQW1 TaxID=1238424 RepID=U1PE64_9EURY|nr:MAG: hypothetical protein J07HQW1_01936 [Haloquadratum walsbyi J07HQW1]
MTMRYARSVVMMSQVIRTQAPRARVLSADATMRRRLTVSEAESETLEFENKLGGLLKRSILRH